MDRLAVQAVALVVVGLRDRCVDRDLVEVGPAQARELGIEVGVDSPASSGSFEKSIPGTRFWTPKATCSVSAKKLSGLRSRTIRPTGVTGTSSSGHDLGGVEHVEAELVRLLLGEDLEAQLVFGEHARLDRFPEVAAVEVRVGAGDLDASSQSSEWVPAIGFQWNLTKRDSPCALTSRKVCTPKPCIMRKLRGRARSDITHISMCGRLSGISDTKSQNVSWALAACGIPWCGSGLSAWTRSGNFIASWMKKTGMLLPTMSKLPSSV